MTDVDTSTIMSALTLLVTVAVQLIAFSKMIGKISARLDAHDESHIRHQVRIDEHARILTQHERSIAVLEDRKDRDAP